jgi:hypothetical protein
MINYMCSCNGWLDKGCVLVGINWDCLKSCTFWMSLCSECLSLETYNEMVQLGL